MSGGEPFEGEFLIRRTDHDFVDFHYDRIEDVLVPSPLFERIEGWGSFRMRLKGTATEIVFSDEIPGLQVFFRTTNLDAQQQREIVEAIATHLGKATSQDLYVLQFEKDGPCIRFAMKGGRDVG